jgi:hypothetical protein
MHQRIYGIHEMVKTRELREQNESLSMPEKVRQAVEVFNSLKFLLDSHSWLDKKGLFLEDCKISFHGLERSLLTCL